MSKPKSSQFTRINVSVPKAMMPDLKMALLRRSMRAESAGQTVPKTVSGWFQEQATRTIASFK